MGWSYNFWRPGFYPEKLASAKFLAFYTHQLPSVEVDSTFYRIPRETTVKDWKNQTPADFTFSLKFPQKITHIKMLKEAEEDTRVFLERAGLLGEKLGVLLLQFSPAFRQQHFPLLRSYLESLPKMQRCAVEVRNKSLLTEELYALLREHRVTLAWVDAAKMPLVEEVTADFVYVRWEGDRTAVTGTLGKTEVDRTEAIQAWAKKLMPLLDAGTEVFGYFSKYYSGNPTADAKLLQKLVDS
jgi:uncharacterized protein YecE (DUF72 family)